MSPEEYAIILQLLYKMLTAIESIYQQPTRDNLDPNKDLIVQWSDVFNYIKYLSKTFNIDLEQTINHLCAIHDMGLYSLSLAILKDHETVYQHTKFTGIKQVKFV